MGDFFGELYLRSTLPLLSPEVTAREVDCLARLFSAHGASEGPVLDLGCGHGRHLGLASKLGRSVIGVEKDARSLQLLTGGARVVRADLRALPLRNGAAGGAFAWYSTLFSFGSDEACAALLGEIARVLRPGALLVAHTAPYERFAANPTARFRRDLPDGGQLEEESAFDPRTGLDRSRRTLRLPDGRVLSGENSIRYYRLSELEGLLRGAGMRPVVAYGGLEGERPSPGASDLIVGAIRSDA
ncbi:MAG TPA: class I SAM-dependent methyltransferase [Myxococcaceae bacterium]|nr:class I SAM-dependent methyltransferase [Myxococcaceae bacterium]